MIAKQPHVTELGDWFYVCHIRKYFGLVAFIIHEDDIRLLFRKPRDCEVEACLVEVNENLLENGHVPFAGFSNPVHADLKSLDLRPIKM
ncbi:MAG: hypothetical protein IPO97_12910 [Sphingomonadales bacterium]|nr:hypothetical protein [Sphingomonadales bacterium]